MLLWALEVLHWQRCEHCRKAVLVGSSLHHFSLCFSATVLDHSSTSGLWAFLCLHMLHDVCLFVVSVAKGSHFPLNGLSHVLLGVPPRSVPALSLLLLRPRPTKFVKNFAQLFMKGNELQVVLSRIITRYPPLSIDPPVSLEVEVIANWPQNCSLPLGLARKRCQAALPLLTFCCFMIFLVSLSIIILLLLRLPLLSPLSSD